MRNFNRRLGKLEQGIGCIDCPYQNIKRMSEEEIDARIEELLEKGGYYKRTPEEFNEAIR